MNELIKAAKAVIAEWDDQQVVGDRKLRAAVELAERQEAVGFDEWWRKQDMYHCSKAFAITIWTAAQQAERERIKQIITYQFGDLVSDLSDVMEQIDSGEE